MRVPIIIYNDNFYLNLQATGTAVLFCIIMQLATRETLAERIKEICSALLYLVGYKIIRSNEGDKSSSNIADTAELEIGIIELIPYPLLYKTYKARPLRLLFGCER